MKASSILFPLIILTGCDNDFANIFLPDEGGKPNPTYTRQVLDSSYLYDAIVCSDIDGDYKCSESETIKETNFKGEASVDDGNKPTIAKFIISKTVSSDPYHAATDNYELIGLPQTKYVTPFTTYSFLSKRSLEEISISLGLKEKALEGNYIGFSDESNFAEALARSFILRFNAEGISYYAEKPEAVKTLGAELRIIAQRLHALQNEGVDLSTIVINID